MLHQRPWFALSRAGRGIVRPLVLATALAAGLASTGVADAATFRISTDAGFGAATSRDPISPKRDDKVASLVYSRLVRLDEAGKPAPDLATEWTMSDDLTEWTFKLRSGVKFHNGADFTSADVVYSLERILSDKIENAAKSVLSIIDTVDAVDPLTVKIKLKSPFSDLPLLLLDYRIRILSAGTGDLESYNESGIGTGPFQIAEYDPEGTSIFTAFPDYWEGKPGVDEIDVFAIPDQQARVQALLSGQIDWLPQIDRQEAKLFADTSKFKTQTIKTGNWEGLVMLTNTKPYDDVRVRKALRIAVDREAMRDLLVGKDGGTISCDSPVWTGDQYYVDIGPCGQDIEGAKKLLAEAGYPDGIDVELIASDLNPLWTGMAEIYQQQVAPAGIRVTIKQVPSAGYWDTVWMKNPFMTTLWGQRPADQVLNEGYRSTAAWNESKFQSPELDALLDKARSTADFEARKAVYGEIQKLLWEQGGTLVPFHDNVLSVMSTKVEGLQPTISAEVRWHQIRVTE